jgi:general stress protein 26
MSMNGRRQILRGGVCWFVMFAFVAPIGVHADTKASAQHTPLTQGELVEAVRSVTKLDPFPALITVDDAGQPRVRTVEIRPLDESLVFWFATKPNTRKVAQIRQNPKVALYFSVDGQGSYVSVMGVASVHDDIATKERISWREASVRTEFWPDYPHDYLLIQVQPHLIEVLGQGVAADPVTWAPQQILMP